MPERLDPPTAGLAPEARSDALTEAVRRHATVADLAVRALGGLEPRALCRLAAEAVAEVLRVPLVAVLEHRPAAADLVVVAGVGWPGEGTLAVSADALHVADALAAGEPIASERPEDLPAAARVAGAVAGLAVRVGAAGEPGGLVAAYTRAPQAWTDDERAFLDAVAAVLAGALEQQRTGHRLEASEALARAVLDTTVDGIITIDERGRIEGFNAAAERVFGYTAGEVVGRNIAMLMPEPYHSEHDGYLAAYRETGRRRIIGIGREVVGRRKDGSTFPMDLAVSEVHLPNRRLFTGVVRDISARRELEQEVLRVAEEERRRIGQDLHDGLGQALTGTALIARGLARRLRSASPPPPPEAAEGVEEVAGLVKDADEQARALARGLVPVELEANGLDAALVRLAANAGRALGVEVRFEAVGEAPSQMAHDGDVNLYRIAQEALSNAARHGRARHARVILVRSPEQLRLRIEDDGRGFPGTVRPGGPPVPHPLDAPAPPAPRDGADPRDGALDGDGAVPGGSLPAPVRPAGLDNRGMGVRIMHYRARILGGALDIHPGAGGGTVVTCTVPLVRNPLYGGAAAAPPDPSPR